MLSIFPANLPKLKTLEKEIFDRFFVFKKISSQMYNVSSSLVLDTKSHAIPSQKFLLSRTIHIACAQRVSPLCPSPARKHSAERRKRGKRRREGGGGEGGGGGGGEKRRE